MWKVLHSMRAVVLWDECSVLQGTVCRRYCTASVQWYYLLNGRCYSGQYLDGTLQKWTVVVCVECSVLQWTVCGSYCTAGGEWYCGMNGVCYSEQNVEKKCTAGWQCCLRVELSVLQWTVCGSYSTADGQWYCVLNIVYYSEHCVEFTAQQVDCGIVSRIDCDIVNINWKKMQSRWTVVLWDELSVLQWTVCGDTAQKGDSGIVSWM